MCRNPENFSELFRNNNIGNWIYRFSTFPLAMPISNNYNCFNTFLLYFGWKLCSCIVYGEKVLNASLYRFKCNKSRMIEFQFILPSIRPDMIILHLLCSRFVVGYIRPTTQKYNGKVGFFSLNFFQWRFKFQMDLMNLIYTQQCEFRGSCTDVRTFFIKSNLLSTFFFHFLE